VSVDEMMAASVTLLAKSRAGRRGVAVGAAGSGSVASLAANVAVVEPILTGRVIAAWPSFALTASWELLIRQVRGGSSHQVVCCRLRRQWPAPRCGPTSGSDRLDSSGCGGRRWLCQGVGRTRRPQQAEN
jgi:hypothetical protein